MNATGGVTPNNFNIELNRFDPLPHVLSVDTFEFGQHGWATYFPDYDGWNDYPGRYPEVEPLGTILLRTVKGTIADRVDRRFPTGPRSIPQLSRDRLKLTTLPSAGSKAVAKKRLSSPWNSLFRIESYFSCSAESGNASSIAYVSLTHDVHDAWRIVESGQPPRRWWPGVRYRVSSDDDLPNRWQVLTRGSVGTMDGPFSDIEDGAQDIQMFTVPRRSSPWHYLRLTFDLETHQYVDFYCDDQSFVVKGLTHEFDPPLSGFRASTDKTHGLILPTFGIESASDSRCALYLDSVVFSASECVQ